MQFREHKWIYITAIVVLAALAVAGAVDYHQQTATALAEQRAAQYVAALQANGFQIKDPQKAQEFIVKRFGQDGGYLLEYPGASYLRALTAVQLGTAGPASRPVVLDRRVFLAELLALQIYRPDKVAQFKDFMAGMKYAQTLSQ